MFFAKNVSEAKITQNRLKTDAKQTQNLQEKVNISEQYCKYRKDFVEMLAELCLLKERHLYRFKFERQRTNLLNQNNQPVNLALNRVGPK